MLKRLVIVSVFFGLLAVQMAYHQKASAQQHTKTTQSEPPTPVTVNNDDHSKYEQPKEKHVAYWWPEGITAIAIILTLIAISFQTYYTRKAAEAAFAQMEMMKKKERALMEVVFVRHGFTHPTRWDSATSIGFSISVTNLGMTSARNVALYGAVTVAADRGFPPMTDAQRIIPFPPFLKADSDPVIVEIPRGNPHPTVDDGELIRIEEIFLHLYGFVAFTDAFGERRLQVYRMRWKSEEFEVEGLMQDGSGWIEIASIGDSDTKEPPYYENPN